MPIQFLCPTCGRPIEVDDQHARQTASCCYCGNSATVPESSTIADGATVSARQIDVAPAAPGLSHVGLPPVPTIPLQALMTPRLERSRNMAALYGNLGLLCAGIMAILVVVIALYMAPQWNAKLAQSGLGSQPSLKEVERVMQSTPGMNYVTGASCGALVFGVLGAGLAIASIAQNSRGWRGWLALAICGGYLLCNCAGAALLVLGGLK